MLLLSIIRRHTKDPLNSLDDQVDNIIKKKSQYSDVSFGEFDDVGSTLREGGFHGTERVPVRVKK